jgi:hypothetical protein
MGRRQGVVGWVASGRGQMVEWVKEGGGGTGHANQTPYKESLSLKERGERSAASM